MARSQECVACGSENTGPAPGVEGVLLCHECGEFFEDDTLELERLRRRKRHESAPDVSHVDG